EQLCDVPAAHDGTESLEPVAERVEIGERDVGRRLDADGGVRGERGCYPDALPTEEEASCNEAQEVLLGEDPDHRGAAFALRFELDADEETSPAHLADDVRVGLLERAKELEQVRTLGGASANQGVVVRLEQIEGRESHAAARVVLGEGRG